MHTTISKNASLAARHANAVPRGVASATSLYADRAENAEIWDVEGKRYIDFAGGIAVLNVGHRHPRVMAAVAAQAERFTHTAFQVMPYEPYVELCERLNALAPVEGAAKSILFTTGAEAAENAAKIARAATGRDAIITFVGGFHGRSLFASALTGKVEPYKSAFGGMAAGVFHAPFPSPEAGISVEESLRALDFIFRADVSPKAVAAVMLEPVQGEGGFHIASPAFLQALRSICDTHGILLIADEVQTGFARTGKMFAIEHSGIKPDLIAMAKSLGGGFPIAAVSGRAEIMDAVPPGGLGGTYAGSPLACAAALAVLDIIEEEDLLKRADAIGERVTTHISRCAEALAVPAIAAVRTLGAMTAFDIVDAKGQPDPVRVKAVQRAALDRGLVLLSCGMHGNTVRLLMPLTIQDEVLEEGLAILEACLLGLADCT